MRPIQACLPVFFALAVTSVTSFGQGIPPDQLKKRPTQPENGGDRPELVLPRGQQRNQPAPEAKTPAEDAGAKATQAAKEPADPAMVAVELLRTLIEAPVYVERESRAVAAQWVALGEPGLRAARAGLALDEAAPLVTSARVLAQAGSQADHEVLRARLYDSLPREVPVLILRALRQSAPGFFGADELVALLDHQTPSMRAAAGRELERAVGRVEELNDAARQALWRALQGALSSRRPETRMRTLELLVELDPAGSLPTLLSELEDPAPRVAQRAAQLCANLPGDQAGEQLAKQAFQTDSLFRNQAYALLGLMELEDRAGLSLVGPERIPMLLANLDSADALASGVAACALAGVGFRGEAGPQGTLETSDWLDLRVPHRLIAEVSAAQFHQDIGPVAEAARRRLKLLSGVDFGADGPAWRAWWIENARGFEARRAVLIVDPSDAPRVEIQLGSIELPGSPLWLLGPEAPFDSAEARRVRFLSESSIAALVSVLRQEGVLSAQRLPIGAQTGFETETLELRMGQQVKRFAFQSEELPGWYRRVRDALLAELDEQRWQAYIDPATHPDPRSFYAIEAPWWQSEHSSGERARRIAELCIEALPDVRGVARDAYLAELERLSKSPVEEGSRPLLPGDFKALLAALDDELNVGTRVQQLTSLALDCLMPENGADQATALDGARNLMGHLWALYGEQALAVAGGVVERSGPPLARELVFESEPKLRSLAADVLAASSATEDQDLFLRLLSDAEPQVQAQAVAAAGREQRIDLRGEVAVRARLGPGPVRAAALNALGQLGGPEALDVMISGMSSPDSAIQAAAVSGLAALKDPQSLPILASIVDRGPSGPLFKVAAQGLADLGANAHGELMRMAQDATSPGRRAAALILARAGVGQVAGALVDLLTTDARDTEAQYELALLTVVDLRQSLDSAGAYFEWLETQDTQDASDWLRKAQDRAGLVPTPPGALERGGTRAGAFSLWRGLGSEDALLAERSRRELGRLMKSELEPLPPRGPSRDAWRQSLLVRLDERWPG